MTRRIPDSHRDLVDSPLLAVLTTMMPDGQPQSSIVWCDYDGTYVKVNTTRERQKGRNVEREPRVTLLVIDPDDDGRWIEVRGRVTLTEEDVIEHLDKLTREYTDRSCFYGDLVPLEQRALDSRVIFLIDPEHITLDAIHR